MRRKYLPAMVMFVLVVSRISSVCIADVVSFSDEITFKNAAGNPQYLIDFESYGDGIPVIGTPNVNGDEWLNWGIQFAGMEIGDSLDLSEKADCNVSPTHSLHTLNAYDRCSTLITFSTPVVSFGAYIVDNETGGPDAYPDERIVLKDDTGAIIEEFTMPGGLGPAPPLPIAKDFIGYISDIPIAEIYIIEDSDGEGTLLDNVMYSVPEPGTVLLLGFGMVMLRRKRPKNR